MHRDDRGCGEASTASLREKPHDPRKSAFIHAPLAMLIVGRDGACLAANQASCELLGLSDAQLVSHTLEEIAAALSIDASCLERLMPTTCTSSRRGPLRFRKPSGVRLTLDVHITPLERENSLWSLQQAREKRSSARLIREHRVLVEVGETLSSLPFERALSEVATLTASALVASTTFLEKRDVGVSPLAYSQASGQAHDGSQLAADLAREPELLLAKRRALQTGELQVVARKVSSPRGSLPPNEHARARTLAFLPMSSGAEVVGVFVLGKRRGQFSDAELALAHRIARRSALFVANARLNDALRQAVRTRDEMLGIVAHDLRNPVGAIMMQCQLMQVRGPDAEQRAVRAASAIRSCAKAMHATIDDLLQVSRLSSGSFRLVTQEVDPRTVLLGALERFVGRVTAQGLTLTLDTSGPLPTVWADEAYLGRVFDNLISNALKHTAAGGISMGARGDENAVRFWVKDTGEGIAAEHLPNLFDRFWQARQDRTGAGLGLYIVRGIVEQHSGSVWVESAVGVGSCFCFTIPTASANSEA